MPHPDVVPAELVVPDADTTMTPLPFAEVRHCRSVLKGRVGASPFETPGPG